MCDADCAECASVADHVRQMIDREGCAVVSSGAAGAATITYTIGLVETYGHPELVITTVNPEEAMRTMSPFVNLLRHGLDVPRMFLEDRGDEEEDDEGDEFCSFVPVAGVHLTDGTFCVWWDAYERFALPPPALEAIQIVVPTSSFCVAHQGQQWILDGSMPEPAALGLRPNRGERRAAERRAAQRRRRGPDVRRRD